MIVNSYQYLSPYIVGGGDDNKLKTTEYAKFTFHSFTGGISVCKIGYDIEWHANSPFHWTVSWSYAAHRRVMTHAMSPYTERISDIMDTLLVV